MSMFTKIQIETYDPPKNEFHLRNMGDLKIICLQWKTIAM